MGISALIDIPAPVELDDLEMISWTIFAFLIHWCNLRATVYGGSPRNESHVGFYINNKHTQIRSHYLSTCLHPFLGRTDRATFYEKEVHVIQRY